MEKKNILRITHLAIAWIVGICLYAQQTPTAPIQLYNEGVVLFKQQNYAAAAMCLKKYAEGNPNSKESLELSYMLACTAYKLKQPGRLQLLQKHLEEFPDTPYSNQIYAWMGSCYFYEEDYDRALALLNAIDLETLGKAERDEMTYLMAYSYLQTGNKQNAAIWFATLLETNPDYEADCTYYLACIRYEQGRKDDALNMFLTLQDNLEYKELVPYYIADIYLHKLLYDKAEIVAGNYLSAYPDHEYTAEMYRIMGLAYFNTGRIREAIPMFERVIEQLGTSYRDVLYTLGMAYYQTGIYSKVPEVLGQVVQVNDAMSQYAYLYMGLAYLQLMEKNKARMAFEQASRMDMDIQVKEQAAYNYALCIHETSYSAFGESVKVFENFLNEFPNSLYVSKISAYLTDVYLSTRSYEAALASIDRITVPDEHILKTKQQLLYRLATQYFANSRFNESVELFTQTIALSRYDRQTTANAYYWRGEAYYRLSYIKEAELDYSRYLQYTTIRNAQIYSMAYYNLGYIAFNRKDYPEASKLFLKYLQTSSVAGETNGSIRGDACNRIADSYMNGRQFEDAKRYYVQAGEEDVAAGEYAFYQLALVLGLQKDYTGKITLLNRLMGKYPSSVYVVNALYEKGRAYVQMGNNSQAIGAFRELVDKYPSGPISRQAAAEIGLLYYQDNKYEDAIKAYKYVIDNYSGSEEARLALVDLRSIYVDMNRIDEFAALAAAMPGNVQLAVGEQDSLTYIAAEKVYMRGKVAEAKNSFSNYLKMYPQGAFSLNAHYYLCRIALEQKQYEAVLEHSARLLDFPDNSFAEKALIMRGEVLSIMGRNEEAIAVYKVLYEKAASSEVKQLAAVERLKAAYRMRNEIETVKAADILLELPKIDPELRNEALYCRAKSYIAMKAPERANDDLLALSEDVRNIYGAEAKYLLAQHLYNVKNYLEAEKQLLDFIEQSTPHAYWLARSFVLLADVYMATGKTLDARQYLLSLQQNYQGDDDIASMIQERLKKMDNK